MKPIYGTEVDNQIDRSDEEGNLPVMPSGKNMNMKEEDMTDICCIVLFILWILP